MCHYKETIKIVAVLVRLNLSPDVSVSGCENQIISKIASREKNFLRSVQVNLDFPPFCQGIFVKLYLCLNNTIPIRYKENKKTAPSSIQADDVFLANYENIKLGLPQVSQQAIFCGKIRSICTSAIGLFKDNNTK